MRKTLFFPRIAILLLVLAFAISCKKTENVTPDNNTGTPSNNTYTPPAVTFSAPIQGFVVDEGGKAVNGAEIKTGTKTALTDANGYFKLDAAPFTGDFCYIKATKKGFFTGSTTVHGKAGGGYAVELVVAAQNNTVSFAANQGKTITVQSGVIVDLPANSFVTADGKAYSGNVNVATKYLDPTAKKFSSLTPGGDLRAFDASGQNMQLYSYGMVAVEMSDDAGNALQLASGKKATLTTPVAAAMLSNAPTTIPLWYFDDNKGIWIEEGKANLQGSSYIGTVSHFTFWNVDKPYPPAIVKGRVVDYNGNPLPYVQVQLGQSKVYSDNSGNFILPTLANIDLIVDVVDWETGTLSGLNKLVRTPSSGQTLDIGDLTVSIFNKISVKATVVDCNNNPVNGYATIKKGNFEGRAFVTNAELKFYLSATGGVADLTVFSSSTNIYDISQINVPTNNLVLVKDLGTITLCDNLSNDYYFKFTYTLPGQLPVDVVKVSPKIAEGFKSQNNLSMSILLSDARTDVGRSYILWFGFDGTTTGQYFFTHNQSGVSGGSMGFLDYPTTFQVIADSIVMNLDSIGSVGNAVTGTFSGKARIDNRFNDEYTIQPVGIITNGEFRVKRIADK